MPCTDAAEVTGAASLGESDHKTLEIARSTHGFRKSSGGLF